MNKNTHGHIMPEQRRQRWALRKLSVGMCSVLLGFAVMISTVPAVGAAEIFAVSDVGTANAGVKELDTSSHFTATGILDSSLRYASTVYNKVDATGKIMLTMTKWADGSTGWATNKNNEFAGKYLLYFSNDTFYKEIESITIDGVVLEQKDEGALWMVPITKIPKYALIGVVTNHDITITLKDGKTLTDLGLDDKAVSFGSVWIQNDGTIASESISNGYILENNPNIKNEKEAGFTAGQMTQKVMFDINSMSLKSVHTFKPNENYIQSDYGWVIYVKEQIPTELLQYIDRDNITIYNSDLSGKLNSGRKTFTVSMDDNGRVDTSNTPELSIVGRDTKDQLSTARDNTNDIFWGTLGQSRNYTISYQLKDGVSVADFAKAMNDYVQKQQARVLFDHWMEADYLNESNQQILHKPDHGAPPKQLTGSYSNAYLDTNDTDKDGLFDFVEWQIKTDSTDVDTDGDGVPDGQEFLDDNTLPNDASDYLPSKPLTDVTAYDGSKDVTVTGTVSKPLIADPSDTSKLLQITDAAAGNVTVKLQAYDEASNSYTDTMYGTATIPFADLVTGNFSINVGANTIPDGTKVVLVSYSPNGKHAVMGDPLSFSVPDKDKYNANGGTVNQDYGTKAQEQAILDAVTVTETKGGQEVPVSADKIQQKAIKGTIPEPSADGSDQTVTVEVTYADGSKEEATVTISYGEAKDKYAPVGQEVSVNKGSQPNAEAGIQNKNDLPQGTTYNWKAPVDTSTPGETTGTVVVTYPDGTKDEVEVKVNVVDPRTDAEKYNANGGTVNQDYGTKAQEQAILDAVTVTETKGGQEVPVSADKIQQKAIKGTIPEPSADGSDQTVTVEVTYADGSKEEATVTISYGEAKDKYAPVGQEVSVNKGSQPNAEAGIQNKNDLPQGTTYNWKAPVDTSTPGETTGTVVVTYPDGTKDEVEVKVNVVDPRTDAEKYNANGGTVNQDYGTKAQEQAILDAVTVTETKGGQEVPVSADKIQQKAIKGTIPEPSADGSDQTVTVEVTYADGSKEEATVTISYGEAKDKYAPVGQEVSVNKGSQPNAEAGIQNKNDLPQGTTYNWKAPVDTSTPGETTGTVVVTYPDGTKDEVEVKVNVVDPRTDAEKYNANGGTVNQDYGTKAQEQAILDAVTVTETKGGQEVPVSADKIQQKAIKGTIPEPSADGSDQTVTVEVTYADGSKEEATVTISYGEAKDKYAPVGQEVSVNKGSQPNAEAGIQNKNDLPQGTTYNWKAPVDTSTPGETTGTVVVTYPDGTKDEVEVKVNVIDARTDTEKYTAQGGTVNKPYGQTATANEITAAVTTDAPQDKVQSIAVAGNIPTQGKNQPVAVTVTYADGTTDTVTVTVTYGDASDVYNPIGQEIPVNKGSQPNAEAGIQNKNDLPQGTTYDWKTPVDTSTPGETTGTVVVTYPDGTKDEVEVKVNVIDARTDTEKYTAQGGTVNKPYGQTATANEITAAVTTDAPQDKVQSIAVAGNIPTQGKNQPVAVTVTYADGTTDTVTVTVTYGDASDVYNPIGQEIPVNKGSQPNAEAGIQNKNDLPQGTTYDWKTPVDTSTPGETTGTIVVTYPDGTKDEVDVTVNVIDPRTDAEKYTAKGQDVQVNKDAAPNAEDGIQNKNDLPQGTTYDWKTPVDTSTPGETTGTVIVTYPDGSKDEVEVKVNVIDPRTDAEKYQPETIPEIIKPGEKPDLSDNVTNPDELPNGTIIKDITPDGTVDTNTPGEYTGTLEITYPDGSKEILKVQIIVAQENEPISNGVGNSMSDNNGNPQSLQNTPKTGDLTNTGLYTAGALGSLTALFGIIVTKKRKKSQKEDIK